MPNVKIDNKLVKANSKTHTHPPSIAPPPRQVEERESSRKKVRLKRVLKDRNCNTPRAPSDAAWTRTDKKAHRFVTTLKHGPPWETVDRRVTRRLDNMECIEDIEIDGTADDAFLHRALPENVAGTETTLHHQSEIKAKPPKDWKQEMKSKRKEKKREKKTQRLLAAKSMAQQALSVLEYQMYNLETIAVQEEAKRAMQAEELGLWKHNDNPAPMPLPPTWAKQGNQSNAGTVALAGDGHTWSEEKLKELVINGDVPTAIADAGAASSCGKPVWSECGQYKLAADPFVPTGRKSTKLFQYAGGDIAAANEIKKLPFGVREEAREVHMVPGSSTT